MMHTLMNMMRNTPRRAAASADGGVSEQDRAKLADISTLLQSSQIKGVGEKTAHALSSRFGLRTLEVLRGRGSAEEDDRLLAIPGISKNKLAKIRESVEVWDTLGEALTFCRALGLLTEVQVAKLVSLHGERTEEVVRRNPYRLLDLFPRLRFASVDVVARGELLRVPPDMPERARASLRHNLERALANGHCAVPQPTLLRAAAKQLVVANGEWGMAEATRAVEQALIEEAKLGALVQEAPPPLPGSVRPASGGGGGQERPFMISLASMHAAERFVAEAVRRRLAMPTTERGGFDLTFGMYRGALMNATERLAADGAAEGPSVCAGGEGRLAGGVSFAGSSMFGVGGAEPGRSAGAEPNSSGGAETGSSDGGDGGDGVGEAGEAEGVAARAVAAAASTAGPGASSSLPLSELQQKAVERAALSKLMLLTGGPGTGKTYTVRAIVAQWSAQGKSVLLACPTARAANVLSRAVGAPASTIHRLLEYNPREDRYKRNAANPLVADCVVIDEASMLDVHLAGALFHALPPEASILMVGDDDQLPSVGPGAVLHDLLRCPRVPRVALDAVFRQDPSGDIARNARSIQQGDLPAHFRRFDSASALARAVLASSSLREDRPTGCFFVGAGSEEEASRAICATVLPWLQESGYDLESDVQVLSPMKRGGAGTYHLNGRLQDILNTDAGAGAGADAGGRGRASQQQQRSRGPPHSSGGGGGSGQEVMPCVGDRMIQLKNNYDEQVFNGDIGHVRRVWQDGRVTRFTVAFPARGASDAAVAAAASRGLRPSELLVEYTRSALDRDVSLSYALTVHKAQGAEYPVVVMPIVPQHSMMLYRNLLYTALSRAKQLLVLVGSEPALHSAVHNGAASRRVTLLAERVDDRSFAPQVTRHLSD
jgi:ATP-dependent exoDNAse (exonuclease V) alpha subunit